jgi:hypothetical protein
MGGLAMPRHYRQYLADQQVAPFGAVREAARWFAFDKLAIPRHIRLDGDGVPR